MSSTTTFNTLVASYNASIEEFNAEHPTSNLYNSEVSPSASSFSLVDELEQSQYEYSQSTVELINTLDGFHVDSNSDASTPPPSLINSQPLTGWAANPSYTPSPGQ